MTSIFPEYLRTNVFSTLRNLDNVPDTPIDKKWTQNESEEGLDLNIDRTASINNDEETIFLTKTCDIFYKCFDPTIEETTDFIKNKIISLCSDHLSKGKKSNLQKEVCDILDDKQFMLSTYNVDTLKTLCKVCFVDKLIIVNSKDINRIHTIIPESSKSSSGFVVDEGTRSIIAINDEDDEEKQLLNLLIKEKGENIPDDFGVLRKYKSFICDEKGMEKKYFIYEKMKNIFEKNNKQI